MSQNNYTRSLICSLRIAFTFSAVVFFNTLYAQQKGTIDSTKFDAYKNFVGQILTSNNTGLAPSFSISVADKPSLSGALPIYPFIGSFRQRDEKTNRYTFAEDRKKMLNQRAFVFVNGKIAATEDVTTLFTGGKWKPDAEIGGAASFLLTRMVKYYTAEVKEMVDPAINKYHLHYIGEMENLPITEASQVLFTWLNVSAGYRQSTYSMYDATRGLANAAFDSIVRGAYASANINCYFFPSKYNTPRLTLYGQAGVLYTQKDNNYDDLTSVKGTNSTFALDSTGVLFQKKTDISGKQVSGFKLDYSVNIPIQVMALIHSLDHKFYIGLGGYFNQKLSPISKTTDLGVTLNLPVTKGKDDPTAVVNFQLKFLWADVGNKDKPAGTELKDYRKDKFSIGFTASAPILVSHRRPAAKK